MRHRHIIAASAVFAVALMIPILANSQAESSQCIAFLIIAACISSVAWALPLGLIVNTIGEYGLLPKMAGAILAIVHPIVWTLIFLGLFEPSDEALTPLAVVLLAALACVVVYTKDACKVSKVLLLSLVPFLGDAIMSATIMLRCG